MNTPTQFNHNSLTLNQLDIPSRTGPISPDIWGINIAAALDNFPLHGLLCRAGPWPQMNVGDQLQIFWGKDAEVLQKTIGPSEVNKVLSLFIPSARIPQGPATVSYGVTRVGQASEPSEDLQVLVKLTRPGGHDDSTEPGHSKLIMRIPQIILDGGIDAENIAAGVNITIEPYPNISALDVIRLSWGGVFTLSAPLSQDEADGKTPIVVHITEAIIREAGDSDGFGLSVAFEVYDQVQNRSEDWSAAQRVVVTIDRTRLLAPILKQAVNNTLDLDALGDSNGTARIWAEGDGFELGDTVIVRIKGTPAEAAPINVEFRGEPLTNLPSIEEISVSNAVLRQLANAQLALSYRVAKANGSTDLLSKTQFVNVIGKTQRLAAPIALDAAHGALDPLLDVVRIGIPFDASFCAGQVIQLIWLGTTDQQTPYLPELPGYVITEGNIDEGKPLSINVEGTYLAPIENGRLELYYQLLIDDDIQGTTARLNGTSGLRESIHADVLRIGEAMFELPEPHVAGVVDDALPDDTDGTTLTVNFLETFMDDKVTCIWEGSQTGRAYDSVKLNSLTAGKPVSFGIRPELIKGNNGGTVETSYSIKRPLEAPRYSHPLMFRIGAELATPVITSVMDFEGIEIPHNGLTVEVKVTVRGSATANMEVEIYNNGVSIGERTTVNAQGNWTWDLIGLDQGACRLTAVACYGTAPESEPWNINVTTLLPPTVMEVDPLTFTLNLVKTIPNVTVEVPHYLGIAIGDTVIMH